MISPSILESVKSVTAQYTAEELITKRSEVSDKMEDSLKTKIENEKKIAEAEANAKVMQVQDSSTTENALKLKELEIKKNFIEKWNGVLPSTMLNDKISTIFGTN